MSLHPLVARYLDDLSAALAGSDKHQSMLVYRDIENHLLIATNPEMSSQEVLRVIGDLGPVDAIAADVPRSRFRLSRRDILSVLGFCVVLTLIAVMPLLALVFSAIVLISLRLTLPWRLASGLEKLMTVATASVLLGMILVALLLVGATADFSPKKGQF